MNDNKLANTVGAIMELIGALALTGIALRCEFRRHKAAMKLIDKEIELGFSELDREVKKMKIDHLEKELKELKSRKES